MNHRLRHDLAVDERRDFLLLSIFDGRNELFLGMSRVALAAVGSGVHGEVNRYIGTVELARLLVAEAELRAVAALAVADLEVVDAAALHVVEQDDVDLLALSDGRRQFRM